MAEQEILVLRNRKARTKSLNVRPMIEVLELLSEEQETVRLRLVARMDDKGSIRLNEVTDDVLNLLRDRRFEVRITRIGLYTESPGATPFQEKRGKTVQTA